VRLVGYLKKKSVTMHGNMNVKWARRRSSAVCWPLSDGTLSFGLHCSANERWQRNILKKREATLQLLSDARISIWYYLFVKFFWDLSKLMGSFFKGKLMKLSDGCIMYETRSSQPETLLFSLWRETVFTVCFDSLFCCCIFLYCYYFFVILL
jgi:hypothetical protein